MLSSRPSLVTGDFPTHTSHCVAALPSPLTSFVGRTTEVATLTAMVTDPAIRLVTIVGPGGIGKTRLAIQCAHAVGNRFDDGLAFIGLANIRDPALLPLAVANALGVTDLADQSWIERLRQVYRPRSLLLVLDNLEHLLEATPILTEVLESCPGITLLGTSRTRLNLAGEHTFAVPHLAEQDAIVLFEQRARALVHDFAIQPDSSADIVDICRHLDGLPLAIELAAARTPVLPPNAIRARLDNRMTLLAKGPRDAPARHRGMREAITWSYDLLNRVDQVLFRRLAAFDGGFTLDAAAAVTGMTSDILDGIASLEASSLLKARPTAGGHARFVMLETIREFAQERLREHGEEKTVRQSHANYFVRLADGTNYAWYLSDGMDRLDDLEPELPNIRAALAWLQEIGDIPGLLRLAGSLGPLWTNRGYSREGRRYLEWGLARSEASPISIIVSALRALSWSLTQQQETYRALLVSHHALDLTDVAGDPWDLVIGLISSGDSTRRLGHTETTKAHLSRAMDIVDACAGEVWAPSTRCVLMNTSGELALDLGDIDQAETWFAGSIALSQDRGLRLVQSGWAHRGLGLVARVRGDPGIALVHFRAGMTHALKVRDHRQIAAALGDIAGTLAAVGDYEAAGRLFGASEAHHERTGLHFAATFGLQRALSLPEPWASMHSKSTVADGLRYALMNRTTAIRSVTLDPDLARIWWEEGRRLAVADAIRLALAADPGTESSDEVVGGLSPREVQVLQLLAVGSSNQEIAQRLSISTRTVENHVRNMLAKLDLPSRTAAAAYAIRNDLA